jgi:Beta-propeller repeat
MKTSSPRLAPHVRIVIFLLLVLPVPRLVEAGPNAVQSSIPAATKQKLAKVQIPFIANQGQSDEQVKFYARTFAGTVFVTETGELVYSFPKLEDKKRVAGVTLKEELIGGKVTDVKGESPAVTKLNYFKGNDRSKWQSNIPSYDVVSLGEVYEGIELKLKAYGNNVEKLFYVKPGAGPETIKIKLSGGKEIRVNESGELEVETEQGPIRFSKPVAFQEGGGKKEFVEAAYVARGNKYGFKIEDYDRTRELVIDPILAATLLGGSDSDAVNTLALDSLGNVYVAGFTGSSDFPGIGPGSADSTFEGSEAFVAKLNSDLSSILAATFLGGSNFDSADALALDSLGNVYVAGFTDSSDFPGIGPGSADSTFEFVEGFVAKLNSDLNSILAATFLGGGGDEFASALAVDTVGNVYVAGATDSSDFPGIGPGSADSTLEGSEAFVAKLNSDLSSILAATFLGGSGFDEADALALDSLGNVYVAGFTDSSDFPGIGPGSADSTFGESIFEGFVAKLNSDLSSILAATFLGGNGDDSPNALAVDTVGNVYVAGATEDFSSDFPGIGPGSADSTFGELFEGFFEAFVVKLDANLSSGPQIINDRVNFVVQRTSFDPASVPGGPAGTFTIIAVLTNKSTENIREPIDAVVKTLTNGNKLLSATEGNGGAGSKQVIDVRADETLISKESAIVQFRIGLANRNRFSFFVDVSGTVGGGDE